MTEKVVFTEEMRKDYTILIPTMLPVHFKLCLLYTSRCVEETGLSVIVDFVNKHLAAGLCEFKVQRL